MSKFPCPVCGDPKAYTLWIDADPPAGCPEDMAWANGGARSINSVAECPLQRRRAEQHAYFLKLAPECFDANGNMLPGKFGEVLMKTPPGYRVVL